MRSLVESVEVSLVDNTMGERLDFEAGRPLQAGVTDPFLIHFQIGDFKRRQ
jgi:hypothetical protein